MQQAGGVTKGGCSVQRHSAKAAAVLSRLLCLLCVCGQGSSTFKYGIGGVTHHLLPDLGRYVCSSKGKRAAARKWSELLKGAQHLPRTRHQHEPGVKPILKAAL